jgi:indoleacetamide hydrolase
MNKKNISATDLLDSVHSGSLQVADIAKQTTAAVEDNRDINAIISFNDELLSAHATKLDDELAAGNKLPLHGVPILIKDNIETVDFLTTGGTAALANHQPTVDAGVIKRLKDAGALIVGKTNMHELAFGITSNNGCTGAVRNPYDKTLIPGGSSGGSAAAVSAGIVPVSLGSDTGGSNRIPASLCGICGFRPTTDRYPCNGFINLSKTRDTAGVFSGNMPDLILVDNILAGKNDVKSSDIEKLRLAVPRNPFFKVIETETAEVIEEALKRLSDVGATLVEIDMEDLFELNDKISFQIAVYETVRELTDYLDRNVSGLSLEALIEQVKSPDVKHILQASIGEQEVPEQVYQDALTVYRPQLQQMYATFFKENNVDAMIYPTTALTARPIGDDETVELNGHRLPTFSTYAHNGDPSSNAGIPSLSIPAGLASNGLPVGLSIDGPVNCDEEVLSIGVAIEAILPAIDGPDL